MLMFTCMAMPNSVRLAQLCMLMFTCMAMPNSVRLAQL